MARPTNTSAQLPGSFAPRPAPSVSADVAAPILVRTPEHNSALDLAEALGVLNKPVLQAVKAAEDTRKGEGASDAALSKVDHERARKDRAYARGAYEVEAERQSLAFMQEWSTRYANEIDKNAPVDEVVKDFDNSARLALGHWLEDPVAKKIVAGKLMDFIDKTAGTHVQNQAAQRQSAAIDTVSQSIHYDLQNRGSTDFTAQFNKLAPLIGNAEAKKTVTSAILAGAAGLGKPDAILASLPETITLPDGTKVPGPAKDANFADDVVSYTAKATAMAKQQIAQATREQKAALEYKWINDPLAFTKKDYDREIKATGLQQLFTSDELNSYLSRRNAELEKQAQLNQFQDLTLTNPNVRLRILEGTPKPDGKPYTSEDLQKLFNAKVNLAFQNEPTLQGENDQQKIRRIAAEQSAREGYSYQPLANDMQLVPVSDHEKFAELAAVYNQMSPSIRALYVPDTDKRADFDRYLSLLGSGMKPKEASEQLVNRNGSIVKASMEAHAKEWGKQQQKLLNTEMDDGGYFGRATKLKGVANSAQIMRLIDDGAKLRIERGMTPADAVESAKADVLASHYFIKGPRDGTSLMLPLEQGVSRPDAEDALKWFYTTKLKSMKDEELKGVDLKKLRLATIPSSQDNTSLVLIDDTDFRRVRGSPVFTLVDIVRDHKRFLGEEGHRKATEQNQRVNDPAYQALRNQPLGRGRFDN